MMIWMTAMLATMLMAAFEMISWRTKPRRALNGLRDDLDAASGAGSGGGPGNGSGGGIISGGSGTDILYGGGAGDTLDATTNVKTRIAVSGWTPTVTHAGDFSFSNLAADVSAIQWFGSGAPTSAAPVTGSQIGAIFGNAMRSPARGLLPHGDFREVARGRAGASFDDYSANFAPDAANDNAPAPLALAA